MKQTEEMVDLAQQETSKHIMIANILISDSLSIDNYYINRWLSENKKNYKYSMVIDIGHNTFPLLSKYFQNTDNIVYCSSLLSGVQRNINIKNVSACNSVLDSLRYARFKSITESDVCVFFADSDTMEDDEVYMDIETAVLFDKEIIIIDVGYMEYIKNEIIFEYFRNGNEIINKYIENGTI